MLRLSPLCPLLALLSMASSVAAEPLPTDSYTRPYGFAHQSRSPVIAKHGMVRDLLDNGWLRLFALGEGGITAKYTGGLEWAPVTTELEKAA